MHGFQDFKDHSKLISKWFLWIMVSSVCVVHVVFKDLSIVVLLSYPSNSFPQFVISFMAMKFHAAVACNDHFPF